MHKDDVVFVNETNWNMSEYSVLVVRRTTVLAHSLLPSCCMPHIQKL